MSKKTLALGDAREDDQEMIAMSKKAMTIMKQMIITKTT